MIDSLFIFIMPRQSDNANTAGIMPKKESINTAIKNTKDA